MPHSTPDTVLDAIRKAVGPSACISGERDMEPYLIEERGLWHGHADIVVRPSTTEQVAAVVKICAAAGVAVNAQGGNTGLLGGAVPQGGIVLSLSRMNKVRELDAVNHTITVEAGCVLADVQSAAKEVGCLFPLSLGAEGSCQIGGNLSTNAGGVNVLRYGNTRDLVLGVEAVLADGSIWNGLRSLRKDNTGFDLKHLFIGSEGTLGIVTEITLRLHGIPEAVAAATVGFTTVDAAVATVIAVIQSGVGVARIELMDEVSVDAVNRHSKLSLPERPTLFLEFHGSDAGVKEQAESVEAFAAASGGLGFTWAVKAEDRSRLWEGRHNAYYAGLALRPNSKGLVTDVCVPISRLAECIAATKADLANCSMPAPLLGHVGDGNFHVCFIMDPDRPEELHEAERLHDKMVHRAQAMGGTCTGEHGIGLGKIKHLATEAGGGVAVMKAIKAAIDPDGIMNPGKMFG